VFHTLQCTGQRVQWSGPSNETIHAARRRQARYKEAAAYRTISRYETPRYID